jgi:DNA-binding LacI/PurR family transcriptional regulator
MKKDPPLSLRALARSLGVSHTTVSYAFSNHPGIPEKTRRRILRAAKKAGYEVNPLVSDVMRRFRGARGNAFAGTLAYLTGYHSEKEWQIHPTSLAFHEGAQEAAGKLGFRLDTIWARQAEMPGGSLDRILAARGIRGVIFGPWPEPAPPKTLLDWKRYSLVQIGMRRTGLRLNRVASHMAQGMEDILRKLEEFGYRRPGYLAQHDSNPFDLVNGWLTSYVYYQSKLPPARRIPALEVNLDTDNQRASSQAAFIKWNSRYKPDVIIGFTDFKDWLKTDGVKCQQIGFASISVQGNQSSRIAGIDQKPHLIGATAVNLVASDLSFGITGLPEVTRQTLIVGQWVNGPMVRKIAVD